ncbi:MAG: hypothetical protein VX028_03445 [Nanoarchaeota archaeon]|nr:hypothetical protein [Nanoarchaeota archaeon]
MITFQKKAQLYQEIAMIAVSLIIISFIMFSFFAQTSSAQQYYSASAPDLYNTFPITFIHSFLYQELSTKQKEKLALNTSEQVFLIDMLEQGNIDESKEIYDEIKQEYLKKAQEHTLLEQYKISPSSMVIVDPSHLLSLKEISSLDELDCIEKENYFFLIPNKKNLDSSIIVIEFKASLTCSKANSISVPNI